MSPTAHSILTVADKRALLTAGLVPRCPKHPTFAGGAAVTRGCSMCRSLRSATVNRQHEGH